MTIKMNHADGPIASIDTAQQRQGDGVVSTKGNHSRQRLAMFARSSLFRRRLRLAGQDRVVALLDLANGILIIIPALD